MVAQETEINYIKTNLKWFVLVNYSKLCLQVNRIKAFNWASITIKILNWIYHYYEIP